MLTLRGITKKYRLGDHEIDALGGIDLSLRDSEFVSVLGPSGCGKTTLLNIIGGLDRYTQGEMTVNGVPTKHYSDADWDSYRNKAVGFVFQTYNLIPHQTVLSNVELALTLSGVSRAERKKRAAAVLEQVGLGDQLGKKPNQMSGGQMQRVAIARALVNDPDILLADEPTGALDSETSVQVMGLMREIAKDRLVIMVTHNPDLADRYSTRIIRLLDGRVTDDTNPYTPEAAPEKKPTRRKRTTMRFATALALSLNNLMTKKARTFLTSFAGSIGIIGIALILALSSGIQSYIDRVEEDTLSSYPIEIDRQSVDMSGFFKSMMKVAPSEETADDGMIHASNMMSQMLSAMQSQVTTNDTASFKAYLDDPENDLSGLVSDIKYTYGTTLRVYRADEEGGYLQVNPPTVYQSMGLSSELSTFYTSTGAMDVWSELIDNRALLDAQYDVIAGHMPESYDEVVLIVDKFGRINDYALYALGLRNQGELSKLLQSYVTGEKVEVEDTAYTYDELLSLRFKLITEPDFYEKQDGAWADMSGDAAYMQSVIARGEDIRVVGILRPSDEAVNTSAAGTVGYTSALTAHLIDKIAESEIVREQLADPETDVFTGLPFSAQAQSFDPSTLTEAQLSYYNALTDAEKAAVAKKYAAQGAVTSTTTYAENLDTLGVADKSTPDKILIYPKDFEAKAKIAGMIDTYNDAQKAAGNDAGAVQYTDYVEIIMSSVNTIINAISYVLIAFVAISLIVSSIMIGIITYISVLERTKEIGILRAIGASKRDIGRVFNAETLIVGFVAGALGILVSLLLTLPINAIIRHLAGISGVARLPFLGALILIAISMFLTWIAGLIPSGIASRKDPVVALRTE